jgi:hypothetical protein
MKLYFKTLSKKEYASPSYFKTENEFLRVYDIGGLTYVDSVYFTDDYHSYMGMATISSDGLADVTEISEEEYGKALNRFTDAFIADMVRHKKEEPK